MVWLKNRLVALAAWLKLHVRNLRRFPVDAIMLAVTVGVLVIFYFTEANITQAVVLYIPYILYAIYRIADLQDTFERELKKRLDGKGNRD